MSEHLQATALNAVGLLMTAAERISSALALHRPYGGTRCQECNSPYPCPTVHLLLPSSAPVAAHRPCHEGRAIHGRGSVCAGAGSPVQHRDRPVCVTCQTEIGWPVAWPCYIVRALSTDAPTKPEEGATHE